MKSSRQYSSRSSFDFLVPDILLKRGNSWLLIFFMLLLTGSSMVSYNDVIKGDVVIFSKNPPAYIQAKQTGQIAEVFFQTGDIVRSGSVLGVMENTARLDDVLNLKQKAGNEVVKVTTYDSLLEIFPPNLILGQVIQPYYYKFLDAYQNKILASSLKNEDLIQDHLAAVVSKQDQTIKSKEEELEWALRNLNLMGTGVERHEQLYKKGIISKQDMEKIQADYYREQQAYQQGLQELNHLVMNRKNYRTEKDLTENATLKSRVILEADLKMAYQELVNSVLTWENTYLLRSPINGTLSFEDEWIKLHPVNQGDLLFTVLPSEREVIVGRCELPLRNSGRLELNQRAIIKIENYPSGEWGTVQGYVNHISEASINKDKSARIVYLDIKNLETTYGKKLQLNEKLFGTVEIILDEISVAERIFLELKQAITN